MREIIIVSILIIAVILYLLIHIGNKIITVMHYTVRNNKIPDSFDGVKIVLLSDLHGYQFGKNQSRLIEKIKMVDPDYIMISGDMLTADAMSGIKMKRMNSYLNLLKTLTDQYPVYYVPGNHEQKLEEHYKRNGNDYKEFIKKIERLGVCYLDNDTVSIARGDSEVIIWGLKTELEYYTKVWNKKKLTVEHIDELIMEPDTDDFCILLAHNPEYIQSYVEWGAHLVLSGHLHGGIIRLPKIGGILAPTYELFPKIDGGAFQLGNEVEVTPCTAKMDRSCSGVMIVSKGLGTHTVNIRLGNPPELVVVNLKRECK